MMKEINIIQNSSSIYLSVYERTIYCLNNVFLFFFGLNQDVLMFKITVAGTKSNSNLKALFYVGHLLFSVCFCEQNSWKRFFVCYTLYDNICKSIPIVFKHHYVLTIIFNSMVSRIFCQ